MVTSQINKITWLVNTILNAKKITFEELNQKWIQCEWSEGEPLSKRTFHKWKDAILDMFGIVIENENKGSYRYYILNADELRQGSTEHWLLNTYSISNSIQESIQMKERILLEEIPSGREYLDAIIKAMKSNHLVRFVYHNYWRDDYKQHDVEPYFVKLFKQRWYLIGRQPDINEIRVFCLDRMKEFTELHDITFVMPKDFSAEAFLHNFYGVIVDKSKEPGPILLKVSEGQANYLRALPFKEGHQQEVEQHKGYSIFRIQLTPTYDIIQELLRNGETVEVLQPEWLRKEMKEMIERMRQLYE